MTLSLVGSKDIKVLLRGISQHDCDEQNHGYPQTWTFLVGLLGESEVTHGGFQ